MYVVAVTGASGAVLGIRLIECLLLAGKHVSAVVSDAGWETISHELKYDKNISLSEIIGIRGAADTANLVEYSPYSWDAPFASGSSAAEAVIIVPCSMKTLSAAAHGYSDSLITRAVDVSLKEGRKTVIVPRETPVSLIHLENMLALKRAGADIVLPVPGFYTGPAGIDDVVNFITGKILSVLGLEQNLFRPWGEKN